MTKWILEWNKHFIPLAYLLPTPQESREDRAPIIVNFSENQNHDDIKMSARNSQVTFDSSVPALLRFTRCVWLRSNTMSPCTGFPFKFQPFCGSHGREEHDASGSIAPSNLRSQAALTEKRTAGPGSNVSLHEQLLRTPERPDCHEEYFINRIPAALQKKTNEESR